MIASHVVYRFAVPLRCLNCGFEWRESLTGASSCPHCASPAIWLTRTDIPLGRR